MPRPPAGLLPLPIKGGLRTAFFLVLPVWAAWWSTVRPAAGQEVRDPAQTGEVPPFEQAGPVRMVAWNVRNYLSVWSSPDPDAAETRPKAAGEIEAIVAILVRMKPDLLGICEMGGSPELADLQSRLAGAGLPLAHARLVEAADDHRHLALLSRFPIVADHSRRDLTYLLDETRYPVQRGFLDLTVRINSRNDLRLLGVHLKSRRDVPEGDQELMRRNEAHLLRQYVDQLLVAEPDSNLLVYGDCNDTRDQPSIRAIKGIAGSPTGLNDLAAADDSGGRWTYYYPTADEYSRVDYLFASRGLMPEIRERECTIYSGPDWAQASDHRPLSLLIHPGGAAKARRSTSGTTP